MRSRPIFPAGLRSDPLRAVEGLPRRRGRHEAFHQTETLVSEVLPLRVKWSGKEERRGCNEIIAVNRGMLVYKMGQAFQGRGNRKQDPGTERQSDKPS